MTYIALCPGEGLACCTNCKRNQDNNPRDAADPWQSWVSPVTRGEDCALWLPEVTPCKPREP
jgi:hypothetical protein